MGYSSEDNRVRVDFFKPSGKWYTTEDMIWHGWDGDIFQEFRDSLCTAFGSMYGGMQAICLEPYHVNAHPVSIIREED